MSAALPGRRPLVKICGVTRVEDALAAITLGADLLGLNFWPRSPRVVAVERARRIAAAVDGKVPLVGIFVDATPEEIGRVAEAVGLDLIQLHGEEFPESFAACTHPILRAFRGVPALGELERWLLAAGFLIDARADGAPGGTGERWDYGALRSLPRHDPRPLLVAGGLRPETAVAALTASGADGVDVASGVEDSPGAKNFEKMRRLIEEVRSAAT
jgi:phosphoribosylanthranilate isomerase